MMQLNKLFTYLFTYVGVSLCLCVCLSAWKVFCGKTADWIWMTFGVVSGVVRMIGVLDKGRFQEFVAPIGLNGIFVEEKCIQLVREKLTIFPYGQYIVGNFCLLTSEI